MKRTRFILGWGFICGLLCLACGENSSDTTVVIPIREPLPPADTEHRTVVPSSRRKPDSPVQVNPTESAGSANHSLQKHPTGDTGETDAMHTGTICVAPLDKSSTPGKGQATMEIPTEQWGTPHSLRAEVTVQIDDIRKTITTTRGAQVSGLSLDVPHTITLTEKGNRRPYFKKTLRLKTPLCVYDNAFYGTTQISDKPRRRFCKKCFQTAATPKSQ